MRCIRLWTDPEGISRFEEGCLVLKNGSPVNLLSEQFPAKPRWPGKIPHPWPGENPPPDRGVIKEKPPFFASSAGLLAGRNLCPSIEGNWIERLETAFTNDDSHAA